MRKRISWTPEQTASALEMFRSGKSWAHIADTIGCSVFAVRCKLLRQGIEGGIRGKKISFEIDQESWISLNEQASARGRSLSDMMSSVAELLADPVLLENVLDDGVSL